MEGRTGPPATQRSSYASNSENLSGLQRMGKNHGRHGRPAAKGTGGRTTCNCRVPSPTAGGRTPRQRCPVKHIGGHGRYLIHTDQNLSIFFAPSCLFVDISREQEEEFYWYTKARVDNMKCNPIYQRHWEGVEGLTTRMLPLAHICRNRSIRAEEWSGPWPS